MAESYLYNPSDTIQKGFNQVQSGIGNVFAQIITQKQNDYNVAEKTFENINALTDKLGEYGQEEITGKTKSLLDEAANSIIKNGKLDYSQVGKIRTQVNAIKNRKAAIEAGTQMYKELAQTALATKDDLLSLSTTLDGMRNVILNPTNLSAEDMGRQMQSVYQKNINTTKVMGDILSRIAPASEFATTYMKDGAERQAAGTKIVGHEIDLVTGKWKTPTTMPVLGVDGKPVLNPDGSPKTQSYVEYITNAVKQQGAPVLNAIKAQMGENSVFQTDEQIVNSYLQQYIQNKNTVQKDLQAKSADELRLTKSRANVSGIEEKNLPIKNRLENAQTAANTEYTRVKTEGERLDNALSADMINQNTPLQDLGITLTDKTKSVDLGKEVKINSVLWNNKRVPFLATSLSYDKNKNSYYLTGYPNPKSVEGKWESGDFEQVAIPIGSQLQSGSYTNLVSAIRGINSKDSKRLLQKKITRFKELELTNQSQEPQQATKETPVSKISGTYKGYNLEVLSKANQGVSLEDLKKEIDKATQRK